MNNKIHNKIFVALALLINMLIASPSFAFPHMHFYGRPYHYYNDFGYRGYAPYMYGPGWYGPGWYGPGYYPGWGTVLLGTGAGLATGVAVGSWLSSYHGHVYYQ